jgi:AbrB family looped-hinge helix DNA binding protein
MKRVTISSKNQITLPAELLKQRGLSPGQKLYVVADGDDIKLTAKSGLRRFLEEAEEIRNTLPAPKKLVDPLEERRKLNEEWDKRHRL